MNEFFSYCNYLNDFPTTKNTFQKLSSLRQHKVIHCTYFFYNNDDWIIAKNNINHHRPKITHRVCAKNIWTKVSLQNPTNIQNSACIPNTIKVANCYWLVSISLSERLLIFHQSDYF
mmetsp:Transcript_743/g.1400  ORF Transcript_743/g.1400 Transcript_743/m.1400 type:complete len:117 (+) Transcript_743:16-366(+)